MKKRSNYILIILLIFIIFGACIHEESNGDCHVSARIFVEVNWDKSGINPNQEADDYHQVHRVSLRFFPKDGSEPFEYYLETSIYSGYIEVPLGEYSIMAMNESVHDIYWDENVEFTDINDYNKIAATVTSDNPLLYNSFYTPSPGERFMIAAPKLASWSMNDFHVTPNMNAVIHINMRRLTYNTRILATVKNLKSAHTMQGALRGFAQKVYLSSAHTEILPATQFFKLNKFTFDKDSVANGTAEVTFNSFGKLPEGAESAYSMMLDILLIDGSQHIPDVAYEYDLTDVVHSQNSILTSIEVVIELPFKKGDENISVGDWEDDEHINLK